MSASSHQESWVLRCVRFTWKRSKSLSTDLYTSDSAFSKYRNFKCMIFITITSKPVIVHAQIFSRDTAVSLLTERNWRPLPLELVLGRSWNFAWGVELAPPHPKSRSPRRWKKSSSIRSVVYPHRCRRRAARCMKEVGNTLGTPVCR